MKIIVQNILNRVESDFENIKAYVTANLEHLI